MAYSATKPANGTSLVSADMRENFRALKEDDIVEGVAALGITNGMLAASAVSQAKLKTSQGSVGAAGTALANYTLPGGEYGFYPQVKGDGGYAGGEWNFQAQIVSVHSMPSYTTNIYLHVPGDSQSPYAYARQRYVTSSGEVFWIFILRAKIDYTETIGDATVERKKGDILSMYQAPDHPCFGNGGKPLLVSHPFGSYDPETQEIIVINPTHEEVENMKKEGERGEDEPDKDLLEVITENYDIDEVSKPAWPSIPVTVGLPKDYEDKAMGDKVIPIKKVIPQPKGILVKKLRRK